MSAGSYHLHAYHIQIAIISMVLLWALYKSRDFLKECLGEPNQTGEYKGSSKRLVVFMFLVTICFCTTFHTLKQQKFDYNILYSLEITMIIYSGLATAPQIISALLSLFGKSAPTQAVEEQK